MLFVINRSRINFLFLVYARVTAVFGLVAVVFPNVAEWVLVHHGDRLRLRDNASPEAAVTHTVLRLFGALILGNAWLVHHVCGTDDSRVRRAAVQAFAVTWAVSALALLRAQLTHPAWSITNWLAILTYAGLAGVCSHHALSAKTPAFDGLGSRLS